MKRVAFAAVTLTTLLTAAGAQTTGGPPGAGHAYDSKTVETLSGRIVRVDRVPSPRGRGHGLHLLVQREDGTDVPVILGPASFVEGQGLHLALHDRVRITGSRVTIDGSAIVLAAEVQTGDVTVALRDSAGIPLWTRSSRGRGR